MKIMKNKFTLIMIIVLIMDNHNRKQGFETPHTGLCRRIVALSVHPLLRGQNAIMPQVTSILAASKN